MVLTIKNLEVKFLSLWQEGGSINQKFLRGSFLAVISRVTQKGLQFIRAIVLARLLFPTDFGLFGLASIGLNALEVFSQTGFSSAIINEKDDVKKYLNSAWTVNFIRNVFLGFLMFFLIAPFLGYFFQNEAVIPLIKALAFIFFLTAWQNIGAVLLEKEMQFNKQAIFEIVCVLVDVLAVIIAAFLLRSVWALFAGVFANRLAAVVFSYILHPYRPKFTLDMTGAKQLFKYGKWVSLAGIIAFFAGQGDKIMIGRLLEPDQLGYYLIAFSFGTLPAIEVARVLGKVLFPMFSKIQADKERLHRTFIKVARLIFSLTIPASAGLFVLAREAVHFIYSDRWLAVVPILYVIIIYSFLKSFELVENSLFLGAGKPKINTIITIIQTAAMFIAVVPLTKIYGPVGTAWSVLFGSLLAQIYAIYILRQEIILGIKGFFKMVSLPLAASLIMFIVLYFMKTILPASHLIIFLFYIAAGVGLYFFVIIKLDRLFGGKFRQSFELIKRNL